MSPNDLIIQAKELIKFASGVNLESLETKTDAPNIEAVRLDKDGIFITMTHLVNKPAEFVTINVKIDNEKS